MEPQAILADLAQDEGLPEAAILAARERWPEVAPLLVDLVERYAAGEAAARGLRPALFWGFHLLGERRERSAYRPLARLLAIDGDAARRSAGRCHRRDRASGDGGGVRRRPVAAPCG